MPARSALRVTPEFTRAAVAFLLALILSLSCSKDSSTGLNEVGPPSAVLQVSGESQQGTAGKELPNPVVVRVVDAKGHAVKGQTVNFRVTAGGGSVFAGVSTTDDNGMAQERWTLGTVAGTEQTLEVRAVDNETGAALVFATFHATAVADAASSLVIVTAPGPNAISGVALNPQPTVQLTDKYGNHVTQSGISVTASIAAPAGDRTLTGKTTVSTNDQGIAAFTDLAVAGAPGSISLTFNANNITSSQSPAFTLSAGAPASITAVTPTTLNGTVGQPLATLPRVVVKDATGNRVAGVTVLFAVSQNGGTIAPASAVSDANGEAALTQWTLPSIAGSYTLVASLPSVANATVTFTATASAGASASLSAHSPTSIVDTAGAQVVTSSLPSVIAKDVSGNPSPGTAVTFVVDNAGGTLSSNGTTYQSSVIISTDANGIATVAGYRLPTNAGSTRVTAVANGASVLFFVTVNAGTATGLVMATQPGSLVQSGVAFAQPPTVRLRDQYGNIVAKAGVAITATIGNFWTVTAGGTASTDATGLASFAGITITGPTGNTAFTFQSTGLQSVVSGGFSIQNPPPARTPYLQVVSGTNQTGRVTTALPLPFVVRVVDSVGTPMSGVDVVWDGPAGSTVSPTTSKSDTSGLTQTSVTALATVTGTIDGYARLAVDQNSTRLAHFPTTITPGDPAKMVKLSGDQQSGPAGTTLPTEVQIQVQDQYGNGVPGVTTQWTPSSGGTVSLLNPNGVTSGPSGPGQGGLVTANWTLGNSTGSQTLTVTAGSLSLTFTATATQAVGALASLTPVQGDGTSAAVATNVNLGVKATDASGTAIPGISISWSTATSGATVTTTSTTDQTGIARAIATLATVTGPNRFSASAPASPGVTPAAFTVTGTPGRACRLVFTNMGQTGDRGDPLPVNVQMAVYDSLNNPVPGFTVGAYFRSAYPDVSGTITQLTTDNTGLASSGGAVTLGSAIGSQEIDQNTVRPCFWNNAPFVAIGVGAMNALATPVAQLANITFTQSGPAGSSILLKVRATDRHGFYVPNATLNAAITSGDGTFGGGATTSSTTTNGPNAGGDAGTALLSYTIGSAASQQITVTSTDGPSVVITIQRNP